MLRILATLVVAGFIAGCSTDPVSSNQQTVNPDLPFAVSKSTASRDVVLSTDARITVQAASINKFAVNMYKQIIEENKNAFLSPYSITSALGMTDLGAGGTTDEQIRQALAVTLAGDDFHAAMNGLNQSLETHSDQTDNLELNIENSVWAQDSGIYFKVGYLDKLVRHYNSGVYLLDFINEPEPSRIIINDWVAAQTNQRILDLLPSGSIGTATRLVLTNAIYFLADWMFTFDSTLTSSQSFTRFDGSSVSVAMMSLSDKPVNLLFNQSGNIRLLELPYKGDRIAMDLVLPDSGMFTAFEDSVTHEGLTGLIAGLDTTKLYTVKMPRFQFTTESISIKKALQNLGMTDPFTESADFSGIANIDLMIADVYHKAFVKVDESGTEAAAATAVVIETTSSNIKYFNADRPFMYLIRDKQTNTILFIGRILDPVVTE